MSMDLTGFYRASRDSHKGENGRVLVIGGSELFHSSIFWSADVASKIVDLVHFASPAMINNELIEKKAKEGFWNGIVVPFDQVEAYIEEDDVVLIGPGMQRIDDESVRVSVGEVESLEEIEERVREFDERVREGVKTKWLVDYLLKKYADKKWIVDGGALQEVDPQLLNENMIITPHHKEWERLLGGQEMGIGEWSRAHHTVTVLLKGQEDQVCQGGRCERVGGGSVGLTKGGTGDVLAGLAAALFAKNESFLAARVTSEVMKKAGEVLEERVGSYFSAADVVDQVPVSLHKLVD